MARGSVSCGASHSGVCLDQDVGLSMWFRSLRVNTAGHRIRTGHNLQGQQIQYREDLQQIEIDTAEPDISCFHYTHSSSFSNPGAYITHNAALPLSDFTLGGLFIRSSFLWSHKRLYTTFFFHICSNTPPKTISLSLNTTA